MEVVLSGSSSIVLLCLVLALVAYFSTTTQASGDDMEVFED
jgi:hypothetical protein